MKNNLSLNIPSNALYKFKGIQVHYSNVHNKVIISNKLDNEAQYNLFRLRIRL